jgi:hypothetical protein
VYYPGDDRVFDRNNSGVDSLFAVLATSVVLVNDYDHSICFQGFQRGLNVGERETERVRKGQPPSIDNDGALRLGES